MGRQRNVMTYRPRSLPQCLCLGVSYAPPLIALAIQLGVMYPYLRQYCYKFLYVALVVDARADDPTAPPPFALRLLLVYSVAVGLLLFGLLLGSFFQAMFSDPGYLDLEVWRFAPLCVDKDDEQVVAAGSTADFSMVVLDGPLQKQGTQPPVVPGTQRYVSWLPQAGQWLVRGVLPSSRAVAPVVRDLSRRGEFRWCVPCDAYKPDDAHHCSDCNRCIRRMDHHCPWINNCVGADNTKFFILFLTYIPICAAHIVLTVAVGFRIAPQGATFARDPWLTMMITITALAAALVGIVLGSFACIMVCMAVGDETTLQTKISSMGGKRRAAGPTCLSRVRDVTSPTKVRHALSRYFGPRLSLWLLPVHSAPTTASREAEVLLRADEGTVDDGLATSPAHWV